MPSTPSPLSGARLRRAAALAAVGALTCALAACTGSPAAPGPTPTSSQSLPSSPAPIFASDEEALAAAVAAHDAYLSANDQIIQQGAGAERILGFTTPEFGSQRVEELTAFIESGLRSTGETRIDTVSLAEYASREVPARIDVYACIDVSATRLFNSEGADVTPTDRDVRVPVMLAFEGGPSSILMSGSQLWSGENFC